MAENILIPEDAGKAEKYGLLLPQLDALLGSEKNLVANLANFAAALKETFNFFWVGFYLVNETRDELVLGPFQGPVACTRIAMGKGVCGNAWQQKKAIIVDDVEKFPGHIACSVLSRSEIVVPLIVNNEVAMVLDVDSTNLNSFDDTDASCLEELLQLIKKRL